MLEFGEQLFYRCAVLQNNAVSQTDEAKRLLTIKSAAKPDMALSDVPRLINSVSGQSLWHLFFMPHYVSCK